MTNLTSRQWRAFGLTAALLLDAILAGVYDLFTVKCMHGRMSGTRDGCMAMSLSGYALLASIGVTAYFLILLIRRRR